MSLLTCRLPTANFHPLSFAFVNSLKTLGEKYWQITVLQFINLRDMYSLLTPCTWWPDALGKRHKPSLGKMGQAISHPHSELHTTVQPSFETKAIFYSSSLRGYLQANFCNKCLRTVPLCLITGFSFLLIFAPWVPWSALSHSTQCPRHRLRSFPRFQAPCSGLHLPFYHKKVHVLLSLPREYHFLLATLTNQYGLEVTKW